MAAESIVQGATDEQLDLAAVRVRLEDELRALWYELWTITHDVQHLAWPTTDSHDDPATDRHLLRALTEVQARLAGLVLADVIRDAKTCASLGGAIDLEAA